MLPQTKELFSKLQAMPETSQVSSTYGDALSFSQMGREETRARLVRFLHEERESGAKAFKQQQYERALQVCSDRLGVIHASVSFFLAL